MPKRWQQGLLTLIGLGFASLFIAAFSQVNPVTQGPKLYMAAGGLAVITWSSGTWRWPLRLITNLAATVVALWWLVPLNLSLGLRWLVALSQRVSAQAQSFIASGQVDMANTLSVVLALLFVACLLNMVLLPHLPMVAGVMVASYLAMVHVFNDTDNTTQFALLIILLLAVRLVAIWRLRAGLSFLLCASAIIALTMAVQNTTITNFNLMNWTMGVRAKLNATGFYEKLDAYVNGPARTGYSDNDQALGGPVHDDPTPVITVQASKPQYLRVQFKTNYSGSGWTTSADSRDYTVGNVIADPAATTVLTAPAETITITRSKDLDVTGIPYGRLTFSQPRAGLYYDPDSGRLLGQAERLRKLTLTVTPQNPTPAQLRTANTTTAPDLGETKTLPKALPKRVRTLAQTVTKNALTRYDQVKAIEHYLATNSRFAYSKADTPHTPKGRDYVDYFLFDSRIGYCDNFSSAMVVMLRSLNIPARWAKGFAPGQAHTSGATKTYTITNADAHSWPEVYFGQYGWLRFEPTPGFGATTATTGGPAAGDRASSSSRQSSTSSRQSSASSSSKKTVTATTTTTQTTQLPWGWLALGAAVLLVIGLLPRIALLALWLTARRHVRPWQYRALLTHLHAFVKTRPAHVSLLAYAKTIDAKLNWPNTFTSLTKAYEAATFGAHPEALEQSQAKFSTVIQQLALAKSSAWVGLLRQCHRKHH